MNRRVVSTLTAATAGVGLTVAATSAKAFVPVVAAALIAGGALAGGAVLGSAATNYPYGYYPYGYPAVTTTAPVAVAPAPVTVAEAPAVTVNSTSCYFTHRWINGIRHSVRVCNTVTP